MQPGVRFLVAFSLPKKDSSLGFANHEFLHNMGLSESLQVFKPLGCDFGFKSKEANEVKASIAA